MKNYRHCHHYFIGSDQQSLTAEENKPSLEQQEKNLRKNLLNKVNVRLKALPNHKVRA
jgi:hypothetical protein